MTSWDFNSGKTYHRQRSQFRECSPTDERRGQLAVSGSRQTDAIRLTRTDPICRSKQSYSPLPKIVKCGVQLLDGEHCMHYWRIARYDSLTSYNFECTRDEGRWLSKRLVHIDRSNGFGKNFSITLSTNGWKDAWRTIAGSSMQVYVYEWTREESEEGQIFSRKKRTRCRGFFSIVIRDRIRHEELLGSEKLLVHQTTVLSARSIRHVVSGARSDRKQWSAARAGRGQVRPCSVECADEERMYYARRISQSADKEASGREENQRLRESQARSSFEGAFCVRTRWRFFF